MTPQTFARVTLDKGDLAIELSRRMNREQRIPSIGGTGRNISPTVRRPLPPLTDEERERLKQILREEGIN